jgi:hypothetical protein
MMRCVRVCACVCVNVDVLVASQQYRDLNPTRPYMLLRAALWPSVGRDSLLLPCVFLSMAVQVGG